MRRYLVWVLLLALVWPALADPDGAAETRQKVIGVWTPSRGYYNYRSGQQGTTEANDYHTITKVLADGTWTNSLGRHGTWAVEEENVLILEPKTFNERVYKLTFLGDEMVRKGPYNRDGMLTKASECWTYFENIEKLPTPTVP